MSTFKSLMDLNGRSALVTGASGFLGAVICDTLAELGSNLILVDMDFKKLAILTEELREKWNVSVIPFTCNLENPNERDDLIKNVHMLSSGLNIIVNNASFVGTSNLTGWATTFEEQGSMIWGKVLEVNLTSVFDICQKLTTTLKKSGNGSIINIGSIYGELGPDWRLYEGLDMGNPAAYSAAKGGLLQLTRWLATTVAPDIRVNAISPGGIIRNHKEVFIDRYSSKVPLRRMATENDIRGAIGYLASDLSRYVTGENIHVDGGFNVW